MLRWAAFYNIAREEMTAAHAMLEAAAAAAAAAAEAAAATKQGRIVWQKGEGGLGLSPSKFGFKFVVIYYKNVVLQTKVLKY